MCRSVPQMEAIFTLTSTSLRPKAGTFTSRISAPGAASGLTTASIVDGIGLPYESRLRRKTYDSSTLEPPDVRPNRLLLSSRFFSNASLGQYQHISSELRTVSIRRNAHPPDRPTLAGAIYALRHIP